VNLNIVSDAVPIEYKARTFYQDWSWWGNATTEDFYDANGSLFVYPVQDENVPSLQTKLQKTTLMKLLAAGKNKEATTDEPPTQAKMKQDARSPNKTFSPKGLLLEYIKDILIGAGESGDGKMSSRALSYLNRLVMSCVDAAAKDLLNALIDKYAFEQDVVEGKQLVLSPPNPVAVLSSTPDRVVVNPVGVVIINPAVDFDGEVRQSPALFAVCPATHNENDPVLLAFDRKDVIDVNALDDDKSLIGTTTTTEFLSELKEEVVLQSLLHKRIHEKKERVFELHHQNGRRLLVVLPPNIQSVPSFEEEARKTNWVGTMLNTEDHVEGMLTLFGQDKPRYIYKGGKESKTVHANVDTDDPPDHCICSNWTTK
jgi:hypothetical protein